MTSSWFDRRVITSKSPPILPYLLPLTPTPPNSEVTCDVGLQQSERRLTPINNLTKANLTDLPPAPRRGRQDMFHPVLRHWREGSDWRRQSRPSLAQTQKVCFWVSGWGGGGFTPTTQVGESNATRLQSTLVVIIVIGNSCSTIFMYN